MCNVDIVDYVVCTIVIRSCSLCKKSSPLPKSNDYWLHNFTKLLGPLQLSQINHTELLQNYSDAINKHHQN